MSEARNPCGEEPSGITRRGFLSAAAAGVGLAASSKMGSFQSAEAEEALEGAPKKIFTDSFGRVLSIPVPVQRVVPARPAVQIFLVAACPEKVAALAYEPPDYEKSALPNGGEDLPVVGSMYKRQADEIASLLSTLQDAVIVDIAYRSDAEAKQVKYLQEHSSVPVVAFEAGAERLGSCFRDISKLLDGNRGEAIARYVDSLLSSVSSGLMSAQGSPRVLFCDKKLGCEFSYAKRALQGELIKLAGGTDAMPGKFAGNSYGLDVSPQEMDCDVVIAPNQDAVSALYDENDIRSVPWQDTPAVRNGAVHCFDLANVGASSGMPLLIWYTVGLKWLAGVLHPEAFDFDGQELVREFTEAMFPVGR